MGFPEVEQDIVDRLLEFDVECLPADWKVALRELLDDCASEIEELRE
jgi:hypothetical protein